MLEILKGRKKEETVEDTVKGAYDSPIVASARTGLAGKDDAILRRIPVEYADKTVQEALDYIVGTDVTDEELPFAMSIKKELGAEGSVVVANLQTANLADKLDQYLVAKEHQLPDGSTRTYRELEFEVSAVQQGGYL
jgi:hypothetical protein